MSMQPFDSNPENDDTQYVIGRSLLVNWIVYGVAVDLLVAGVVLLTWWVASWIV